MDAPLSELNAAMKVVRREIKITKAKEAIIYHHKQMEFHKEKMKVLMNLMAKHQEFIDKKIIELAALEAPQNAEE